MIYSRGGFIDGARGSSLTERGRARCRAELTGPRVAGRLSVTTNKLTHFRELWLWGWGDR